MNKILLTTSLVLASGAAAVTAAQGHQPPFNIIPWLPIVVSAIPLLVPSNLWACLVVTVWLVLFAMLGALSVGMFYAPSAVVMLIATLLAAARRSPAETREPWKTSDARKGGAVKRSVWAAFALTLVISMMWLVRFALHTPKIHWPAYPLLLVLVASASLPLWCPSADSPGAATALLAAFAFFPITIAIGAWYTPALVLMACASVMQNASRNQ